MGHGAEQKRKRDDASNCHLPACTHTLVYCFVADAYSRIVRTTPNRTGERKNCERAHKWSMYFPLCAHFSCVVIISYIFCRQLDCVLIKSLENNNYDNNDWAPGRTNGGRFRCSSLKTYSHIMQCYWVYTIYGWLAAATNRNRPTNTIWKQSLELDLDGTWKKGRGGWAARLWNNAIFRCYYCYQYFCTIAFDHSMKSQLNFTFLPSKWRYPRLWEWNNRKT